jgi:hypothetical protein
LGIGDGILDHDALRKALPRSAVDLDAAEFLLRQLIAPVAEAALGEFHDVPLVHERHAGEAVLDRMLDRGAHESCRALHRHRLHADSARRGEADFLDAHFLLQKADQPLGLGRA